jgi:hypothetical protein
MTRVLINFCSIEELMSLPGVGAKGADNILEMRGVKGDFSWGEARSCSFPLLYLLVNTPDPFPVSFI